MSGLKDVATLSTEVCSVPGNIPSNVRSSKMTRTSIGVGSGNKISLTTVRNFYLLGHLTQADISFLTDFPEFVNKLQLVNGCLVSLGKSAIIEHGYNVIVRDTMLLAPGGKKSLASIGSMYGPEFSKITLSE